MRLFSNKALTGYTLCKADKLKILVLKWKSSPNTHEIEKSLEI